MSPSEKVILRRLARELDRISPAALRAANTFFREGELSQAIRATHAALPEIEPGRVWEIMHDLTEYDDDPIAVLKGQLTTSRRLTN